MNHQNTPSAAAPSSSVTFLAPASGRNTIWLSGTYFSCTHFFAQPCFITYLVYLTVLLFCTAAVLQLHRTKILESLQPTGHETGFLIQRCVCRRPVHSLFMSLDLSVSLTSSTAVPSSTSDLSVWWLHTRNTSLLKGVTILQVGGGTGRNTRYGHKITPPFFFLKSLKRNKPG